MKIKRLLLKNIRSYKSEEIIFPEGSILLAGDIGSGKTSLLLAIEYSLFGLQPGQRGASLLRNSTDHGSVSLELEIGGKDILIERKLRRNHKSVTNEYASITVNKEKIEASLTEIKIRILEYMGYPQEFIKKNNLLYRYTVYTPQEQMKQIILEEPEIRLNVLRHILGIDKYKRIRENLSILLNHLKEESKILQGEIKNLDEEKSKLELKKTRLKSLMNEITLKMHEVELKIAHTKKIESEVLQLETRIKEKESFEKEIEKTRIMLSNKYESRLSIENELNELKKTISEVGELFNEEQYQEIISRLIEKNKKIEALNIHYANIFSEIASLEKQQQETLAKKERIFRIDICPTCLQDVPEAHKHNILNETENTISRAKQRISLLEKDIPFIINELKKEKLEKQSLEEQKTSKDALRTKSEYLEKMNKRCQNLTKIYESLGQDIVFLDQQIDLLRGKILGLSKFDALIKLKKSELQSSLLEERRAEISLAEIKKEIELTKVEIDAQEISVAQKEKTKQNLSYVLELHDWLSMNFLELVQFTERNILMKLRQEFSRIFSKWFSMLVPQTPLNVRLDESFSVIALHNDVEMEYSFLSGGERTAIALAYRLALNQTINSMLSKIKTKDIVILDEPTDGFSEFQLERMNDVLRELKVSQLIIVSHEQKIERFVDNVIKIKKINDVSQLESNYLSHLIPISFQQDKTV